ncbi:hypothetical protein F183_A03910 [Bryobacterales bacterium F-183]|nr:hypothetical protein F183_A03910 [Bryobacterales bacterium F-183]
MYCWDGREARIRTGMCGGRFHYTINMPKIWEPGRAESILQRLESLRADTKPQWGKFTSDAMLFHCTAGIRMALGELEVLPKISLLAAWPVKKLVIYVMPFPKNAPTAPELLPVSPVEFGKAKREFLETMDRLRAAGQDPEFRWAPHAAFGRLTPDDWGTLMHKHIDYHWKQFGL